MGVGAAIGAGGVVGVGVSVRVGASIGAKGAIGLGAAVGVGATVGVGNGGRGVSVRREGSDRRWDIGGRRGNGGHWSNDRR